MCGCLIMYYVFVFSSRRRHTRCALVTGVQTCALPIYAVVLVAVGRYTEVKRLGLLIRAFADAQRRARRKVALVLVGGHPGEWEDEHPVDAIRASGATDRKSTRLNSSH